MEAKYYRHFKGGKYKLISIAQDSESLERVVVYQALYGLKLVWVRPYNMFFGTVQVNGVEVPRFKEITKEDADESE